MKTSTGSHRNPASSQDRRKGWKWMKDGLLSERAALIGLSLVTVAVYGLVLFARYRAFEARTVIGL